MKLFPLHLIPNDTRVDFMRLRWISIGIAALLMFAAIGAIAFKGFNFALDFTGGTLVELEFQQTPNIDTVRNNLDKAGFGNATVQTYGAGNKLLVRTESDSNAKNADEASSLAAQRVLQAVNQPSNPAKVVRSTFLNPQVGSDLAKNAAMALAFVIIGFLGYISFRFEWKFAVAAIIATMHDVLICAGFFAATGREFDLTVLAGLLSVMGYSINDTIVVFDRVRENFRSMRADPREVLNASVNQTLSRTIITSFVAFLTVLALYIYGGGSLEGMALSQMMGIVIGTLSSIFIACALLTIGPLKVTRQDLLPRAKDNEALNRRP